MMCVIVTMKAAEEHIGLLLCRLRITFLGHSIETDQNNSVIDYKVKD
jgi:hypothetical protein